jgi:energy-coupling factor transport system ATP-binding protein
LYRHRKIMITVRNFSYTYPGRKHPALRDVSLQVAPGECICLAGHSGSGKSTVLLALRGLLTQGSRSGTISYGGAASSTEHSLRGPGLVFQNAESQILCATVYDEVAFGPENICVPADEINRRIVNALQTVDLLRFGNRNVERFSAGQKQRLCLAAVLAMEPRILLLDEPTSQLDGRGRADLLKALRHLKARGIGIVIAEHTLDPFYDIIDRYYVLSGGTITPGREAVPEEYGPGQPSGERESAARGRIPADAAPVLSAENVSVSYPGGAKILENISLSIHAGERVQLFGANGCGKSTLLKAIAGAIPADSGVIRVAGQPMPKIGHRLGTVALLMQNPQRQLFEDTVRDEVAFTLKRLRVPPDEIDRRVEAALHACEADHLTDRLPLTLSFGEQHRVALASVIAPEPKVLLLDEPFAGLDPGQRRRLLKILADVALKRHAAVVIASHDPLPDRHWADRVITIDGGLSSEGGLS